MLLELANLKQQDPLYQRIIVEFSPTLFRLNKSYNSFIFEAHQNILYIIAWIERFLVADQGVGIAGHSGVAGAKTLAECKTWCDETDGCNSIAWRKAGDCWLKEKCLTEDEPNILGNTYGFKSYYQPCTGSSMRILIHGLE